MLLILSSMASFWSIQRLLSSYEQANETQEVMLKLNEAMITVLDAQTSMRGYLVTGKSGFMVEYDTLEHSVADTFSQIRLLIGDDAAQQARIDELRALHKEFFVYLNDMVQKRRVNLLFNPEELHEGKRLKGEIQALTKRLENAELERLGSQFNQAGNYGRYSLLLIVAAAFIAVAISVLFFIRILRDYNERAVLYKQLQQKDAQMARRISIIGEIAAQISAGNYEVRVDDNTADSLGAVAVSLNAMARSLEEAFNELSDREWHQAGAAELNNAMIGEKNINDLARDVLHFAATYTGSAAGALYILENDGLWLGAGYCFAPEKDHQVLQLGHGLTGQAALEKEMVVLEVPEDRDLVISYAMGKIKPQQIVALPLTDIAVEGVLELASTRRFTAREMGFLKDVAHNVGVALRSAQNRKRLQELLEETQAQGEELRAQHSELEGMNAELEAQTEKLQASEEELRVQQEELQQTNEELAERSVLLEEKNVEIQRKSEDLERSTRYKSEFLANMSHELRTPLNSILLLSRLLSENNEENLNDEQVEFARVIQSSGTGLLGLIDEILDLSKIESGKMELEFTEVVIQDVFSEMRSLFEPVAKEKNISFSVDFSEAPLVIKTDKMRLEQILKNLLSNAVKFTSEGKVVLRAKQSDDAQYVEFTVSDTGMGIPANKQQLVFEAFQQADGSTKRKFGGTGLGLSISRELTKLLYGTLDVHSQVGEGSVFTLRIPIVNAAGKVLASRPQPQIPVQDIPVIETPKYLSSVIPADIPDDRASLKPGDSSILIVEDDTDFAKSLLNFTRQRGYKGVVTVRGDQALPLALEYMPLGILLDVELPVKSGFEVIEELKSNPQTRHIPVHVMSSHQLKRESLLKGAIHFLDKPVAYEQIPEVFARIEQIVNKESQKVLIIEDNAKHAEALSYFLANHRVNSEVRSDLEQGVAALLDDAVDCVILDMGIPDKKAYEILDRVKKNPGLENLPIIVFTGKSLSLKEELKIKQYADSIIVKTAHSYQRMLAEVSLFLHLVEENGAQKNLSQSAKNYKLNDVLTGKTVLVVDDDVRNIYSLTKALEILHIRVLTAIDGKEALDVLRANPHTDIVLLDMMMPNMDGYETATRIRQDPKLKKLPVIALTAKAMLGDREKCINAGASDYITKPVDVDQLISLLRVWLYEKK